MAFKMNRSIIKGTPMHQKAKAKAKAKSIVAKGPVGPDAGLVEASRLLGQARSRTPNIDFTMKPYEVDYSQIEFGERKPRVKKEKQPKVKRKFKLGEKIGDFFVSKAGKIRDAAGNILSGIEERRAQREIERQKAAEEKAKQEAFEAEKRKNKELMKNISEMEIRKEKLPISELKDTPKKVDELDYDPDLRTRFERKAESLGYDLSTPEGLELAKKEITYSEADDTWRGEDIIIEGVKAKDPELEKLRIQQEKQSEASRLAKIERDKKRAEQEEKLRIKKEKKERNQNIREAREYYGPDVRITQSKLDEYIQEKQDLEQMEKDFQEPDSLDPGEPGYEEQSRKEIEERTRRDFVRRDEDGGGVPDYLERRQIGPSPAQKRDDRIFNGAIKGGKVQQNMIKSGYIPR